jgi:hypothetical protein
MSEYYEPYQIWIADKEDKSNPMPLWRAQTRWMLENLQLLRVGRWPAKPSGYAEAGGGRHIKAKAAFATPVEWSSELTRRLEMCHFDGLIVEALYSWGETEERMANYARVDTYQIRHIQRAVIKYISRPKIKGAYRRENH